MNRKNISSNTKWEDIVGYSRAVRVGNIIEVAGTTAVNGDKIVGIGNPYEQTVFIFKKIQESLILAGATMRDVVRTRMFVTNMDDWEEIGRAHGDFFREIKPVSTMLEVSRFIDEKILIEIEVSAIISK
ncbi:RidA family protein [Saprospiraceae bacterium]|mgnify:CR=1 FL=1|jgi:enamine deaminase RidA (YjgF/YER057c/UK114 family)|nr:RidA family protein [Saprospiraceae bacterium]MDC3210393.1 RidA family protein [Saprospiraceae bacterium]MDG1435151.1 RidA family protein [Saprospiraceae bacterium]